MTVSRRQVLKMGASLTASAGLASLAYAQDEAIIIGELNSYVPDLASFTSPYRKGWTLALEEINQSGGINGRALKVISRNDHASPDEGARAAHHLITDEKVSLLFGTYLSHIGLSVAKVANETRTPFIAAEALSDKITMEEGNEYTFRLRPSTYMQTNALAKEAARLPVNRWVCIAPDYEYGHSCIQNFKEFLSKVRPDIEWVHDELTPLFELDGEKTLSNLSGKSFDAVFNATFSGDLENLILALDKHNTFQEKPVVSLLSGEPEYLKNITSPVCNGWIVTGYPFDDIQTQPHKLFIAAYEKRFVEPPALGSLVGYMTLKGIATALKQTPDLSQESLAQTFKSLHFDCPLGTVLYRAIDHQSSMGTFVGRLFHDNGKNRMTDWYYADGTTLWPSKGEVNLRRPKA